MTYRGTIPLSRVHLVRLASLLKDHRRVLGCRWRRLSPGRQALLVLAHLRNGDTYLRLAGGFGIGVATVFRYIREAVDLLATLAPTVTAALWRLSWSDRSLGILDGTLIAIDRLGGDNGKRYYREGRRRDGADGERRGQGVAFDGLGRRSIHLRLKAKLRARRRLSRRIGSRAC